MQRFFDIVFSGLALLMLSFLLLPISLVLKFSGEGEIFFLQEFYIKQWTDKMCLSP